MKEAKHKMHKPHFIHDIRIGIGDMCKITGVTGRQLRYWEERGYIKSLADEKNSARKYSWEMLYKVGSIKAFIDEGYTLAKAVEKSELREKKWRSSVNLWSPICMEWRSQMKNYSTGKLT